MTRASAGNLSSLTPTTLIRVGPLAVPARRMDRQAVTRLPVVLKCIALLLFLPEEASFTVAGLRLTAIRLLFLLLTPGVLIKLAKKVAAGRYRFVLSDAFVLLAAFWMFIGPANVVGTSQAISHGGPTALEFCIGYFATRGFLSEHWQACAFVDLLCRVIAIVALLGLLDPLTHRFLIRDLVSMVTHYQKCNNPACVGFYDGLTRYGIVRATSTLEHPIGFGVVCAIGLLLSAYLPMRNRRFKLAACLVGVIISITSAAWLGLIAAAVLAWYDCLMRSVKFRWLGLILVTIFSIIAIYISVKNPFGFLFRHFLLDEQDAYFRLYTWDVAGAALAHSPWFGLGFVMPAEYDIPYTVDSVWLESALTFGVPGSALIALSIIGAAYPPTTGPGIRLTGVESRLGTALGIIIFLIVFWGFTVHYWGTDWILIALLIGVKAHLSELRRVSGKRREVPGSDRARLLQGVRDRIKPAAATSAGIGNRNASPL